MREIWRPVPSVAGLLASSCGRLMVQPYSLHMPRGGERIYGCVPTRGQWDGHRFIYRYGGRSLKVARLICEAFHGSAPDGARYCLHKNENARNNSAANLAWGTQKENLNAPGFIAYCRSRTGDASPTRKSRAARVAA